MRQTKNINISSSATKVFIRCVWQKGTLEFEFVSRTWKNVLEEIKGEQVSQNTSENYQNWNDGGPTTKKNKNKLQFKKKTYNSASETGAIKDMMYNSAFEHRCY
jgi:hypothetical protein